MAINVSRFVRLLVWQTALVSTPLAAEATKLYILRILADNLGYGEGRRHPG